ncbi:MAG: hypothetical protein JWL67_1670 [Solirubrobacterales bacterium]|jgi:Tfp pilus assembly protein PilX|nr:hypothetical protein [Solirubrobacterales bacterium]
MRLARGNDGFALLISMILLTVMMGLGLGLLFLSDSQQRASGKEQASETAFNVAEASLNTQIGQLARAWPGSEEAKLPSSCTESTSTSTNGCPTSASLSVGYSGTGSSTCSSGTQKDAWGSALTNKWTTYVRDDGPLNGTASSVYNSATVQSAPTWDANGDGKVWARSVGVVQCRMVVLVALASAQVVSVPFPTSAASANWFETSNNGNKVIVNTKGGASQAGGVAMRCNGFKGTAQEIKEKCEKWDEAHGQVNPNTTNVEPNPSVTLTASQLAEQKAAAKAANPPTYFASGKCPASMAELNGKPAYVEGPCELSFNGGVGNSEAKPGFLILVNGTLKLNGNAEFFGTVYAANAQAATDVVVEVHGNSNIIGSIVVDGNGGISFGSSKENLVYSSTALKELTSFAGASATRNSFRVLPNGQ